MAASNPNHTTEVVDTPAVGSAPSPTLVLSPETTLAIHAVSATREHTSPTNLQTRASRWSSFIESRSPPLSSDGDINEHRRTQSWPTNPNRESDVNINQIQNVPPSNRDAELEPDESDPQDRANNSELSVRIATSQASTNPTSRSPSLDNILIPILPVIPEMGPLELNSDNTRKSWLSKFEHIDIDWSMKTMDTIYSASFYAYIRDEKNLDLASIRLSRIIKDYKPRQVALALRWLTQGWSVENTSRLLRNVFMDWLPDLAACVFTLMSKDWPARPQLSLCCAYLLINEPPAVAGMFL
jgi:hypothetical protein